MINADLLQRTVILLAVIAGEAFADQPRSAVLQGIRLIDGMVAQDDSTPQGFLPAERRERPAVFEFSELGFATVDDSPEPSTEPPPVPPPETPADAEPIEPEPSLVIEPTPAATESAASATEPVPHASVLSPAVVDPRYQSSLLPSYYQHGCHVTYAPFGEYLHTAFARQVHRGSAELMTLYRYDFYPEGTPREAELTPRGRRQLQGIVRRMQFTPAPIKLEGSYDNRDLDTARQAAVVGALALHGISGDAGYVQIVDPQGGISGLESMQIGSGLIDMVRSRGRTIRVEGSSTFSGNAIFGQ